MLVGMEHISNIVSLDELATQLRLSRRWLRSELKAGRLPFLQAGRRCVFNAHAVRKALAERAKGKGGVARG
jgi:excisionase family DNA binding protein